MNVLRHVAFVSVALLLALSACSDNDAPTGVERLPLDEDSSIAILAELMRTSSGLTRDILTGTLRHSHPAAMDTVARSLAVVRACTEGGRVALEGSVRKELTKKGTGTVLLSVVQRPAGCRTQAPQEILTLDGEPDRFAMHTRDGEVKLGLADEIVYLRLSDAVLQEVDREMVDKTSEQDGLGAMIAGAVTEGVSSMLKYRVQFPVETIRDVR